MKTPQKTSPPHLVVSEELNEIINAEVVRSKDKKIVLVDNLLRLALRMRRLLPPEEQK